MKQITKMSRLAGQLESLFRTLNADFFDGALDTPVITITPSSRSYAHYTPWDAWQSKDSRRREINIASGTLNRPLENIVASLLHEMVHMYNDTILNVQDTSRNGTYHNKHFRRQAEIHGLEVAASDRYGWCRTTPSDRLLLWLLEHDEYREIEMCRVNPGYAAVGTGAHAADGGAVIVTTTTTKSSSRRYVCPCCGTIIRATKKVNVICGDCMTAFVEG